MSKRPVFLGDRPRRQHTPDLHDPHDAHDDAPARRTGPQGRLFAPETLSAIGYTLEGMAGLYLLWEMYRFFTWLQSPSADPAHGHSEAIVRAITEVGKDASALTLPGAVLVFLFGMRLVRHAARASRRRRF